MLGKVNGNSRKKNFRRAIEIQPGSSEARTDFARFYLLPLGRMDEALQQLRIAEKNDPLSPEVHYWMADVLADLGRNDEAISACEKLPPEHLLRDSCILGGRVREGRAAEVLQMYEAGGSIRQLREVIGCAYARTGRREEAEKVFATTADISRAVILACLGDKDRVFESLDHDATVGPIRMGYVLNRVDRQHRGLLLGDPRLMALRKKVGLPE